MTADKLHFDWNTKGNGKLLPARVFDDGAALYLAWSKDTPLPAILTMSEDRKEGPVNYRMSGEYIVVSPIPQNIVLRYGKRSAVLWPSRRIVRRPSPQRPDATAAVRAAHGCADAGEPAGRAAAANALAPPQRRRAATTASAIGQARQHDGPLQRQADGYRTMNN